jgi:hypothetical protein
MKEVQDSAAGIKVFESLDKVEQAATIAKAIQGVRELRKHTKPVTAEEIIAWKDEGRE